jgi:CubicO group peptidase (beta-lactamase class C family)
MEITAMILQASSSGAIHYPCLRICVILAIAVMELSACITPRVPDTTPTVEIQIPSEIISEIDASLSSLAKKQVFSGSVLISEGENVLLSKGYGMADVEHNLPNTPQTIFRIGSLTKQFTAMAILILQDQNKLTVQDRACKYIPDCPADWQEITIHHLLTHTSGISDQAAILALIESEKRSFTPAEILALFKDYPLDSRPGERFSYSNAGYDVLGYIIEQVSGDSYEAFLQQSVFEPLHMQNTGIFQNQDALAIDYKSYGIKTDPSDLGTIIPYSAGELYSTVEDLYLWNQALHLRPFFSEEVLEAAFTPFKLAPPSGVHYLYMHYGYGWYLGERLQHRVYGHPGQIGGFRTLSEYYPDDQVTVIVLSNLGNMDLSAFTLPSELIFGKE